MRKRCTVQEDGGRILFVFVSACVDGKTLNTPNWSSMADDAITQGTVYEIWGLLSISVG